MGGKRRPPPLTGNPYRLETEAGPDGTQFPTLLFFTKKPGNEDWAVFRNQNPNLGGVLFKPMDKAGCVFKAERLSAAPTKPETPHEPSMFRERVNLSLSKASHKALVEAAQKAGVQAGTLARLYVERALGVRGELP